MEMLAQTHDLRRRMGVDGQLVSADKEQRGLALRPQDKMAFLCGLFAGAGGREKGCSVEAENSDALPRLVDFFQPGTGKGGEQRVAETPEKMGVHRADQLQDYTNRDTMSRIAGGTPPPSLDAAGELRRYRMRRRLGGVSPCSTPGAFPG